MLVFQWAKAHLDEQLDEALLYKIPFQIQVGNATSDIMATDAAETYQVPTGYYFRMRHLAKLSRDVARMAATILMPLPRRSHRPEQHRKPKQSEFLILTQTRH